MKIPETPEEIETAIVELKRRGLIPSTRVDAKLQIVEPEVQYAAARWIRAQAISTEVNVIIRVVGWIFALSIGLGIAGFILFAMMVHAG